MSFVRKQTACFLHVYAHAHPEYNLMTIIAFLHALAAANATIAPLLWSVQSYLFLKLRAFIVLFKEDGTQCPHSTPPHLMLMLHSGSK